MELRSSRSRSKTPLFLSNSVERDLITETQTRITRSSIIKSSSSEETTQSRANKRNKLLKQTKIITSDYSSEEGDNEVSSSHFDENSRNEYLERKSNGNSLSAYKIYKEARKYNHYPKTDYTYSPHSKDRVEIAPGVINMPNMSRKPIHEMCKTAVCSKETNTTNTTILDHSHQTKLRPRVLFTENNNQREYSDRNSVYNRSTTIISHFFEFIQITTVTIITLIVGVFEKPHKWITSIIKILHRIASKVMLLDSWILQGQYNYSKTKAVLALCLLPLLFLAGLWCVSALPDLASTWKMSSVVIPVTDKTVQSIENIVQVRLDSPYTVGLSQEQIKQIAHNLKKSLNLVENEEIIVNLISSDPNLIQLNDVQQESKEHIDIIIKQILENDAFQKTLNKLDPKSEDLLKKLKEEVENIKSNLNSLKNENSKHLLTMKLENQKCCRRSFIGFDKHIAHVLNVLISKKEFKENYLDWLKTIFVAKEELDEKLSASNLKLKSEFTTLVDNNAKYIMDMVATKLQADITYKTDGKSLTGEDYIKNLISEAIHTYDADKTGLVDFALESAGGQILSTRCTESYQVSTAVISVFGIPVWYPTHGPRTVISSKVVPGECWAFQKFPGYLVIQLSSNVNIEAFSYEHVNKKLIPNGKIDSAPKNFSVYGLKSEEDKEPLIIGEYTYNNLGDPLQFFPAQVRGLTFNIIQLVVNSNHGNSNYTCLYRFRVHGQLNQEPT